MHYDSRVFGNSHGLVAPVFDMDGRKPRIGSAHFDHCDPGISGGWQDVGVVMRAFNRTDGIPGL